MIHDHLEVNYDQDLSTSKGAIISTLITSVDTTILIKNSNKIPRPNSTTSLHPPLIGSKSIDLAVRKLSQKQLFIHILKNKNQFDIGKNK